MPPISSGSTSNLISPLGHSMVNQELHYADINLLVNVKSWNRQNISLQEDITIHNIAEWLQMVQTVNAAELTEQNVSLSGSLH